MTSPEVLGQALVAAVVAEGQADVVQPEQVEDRGLHIMDVRAVLGGAQADRIGGAERLSALDPAAGQPHREAVRVVVAAVSPFGPRRAAELAPQTTRSRRAARVISGRTAGP
jgi:hypothetical protein